MKYEVKELTEDFFQKTLRSKALFRMMDDSGEGTMICEDVTDNEALLSAVLEEFNRLCIRIEALEQGLLGEFDEDD